MAAGAEVAVGVLPGVDQNFPSTTFKLDPLGTPTCDQLFRDTEPL